MDYTQHFKSGAFSDCQVTCAGRTWRLHKIILCTRSKFFAAALAGNFSEANSGKVTLEDQDPDTLNDVLLFMYSGNLFHVTQKLPCPDHADGSSADLWLQWYEKYTAIYILADFLILPCLLNHSLNHLLVINQRFKAATSLRNGRCPAFGDRFSERFGACARSAYSLPLRKSTLRVAGKSVTLPGSIRTIFVEFLLATGLRGFEAVLEDLKTSEPQLLVDIILAKAFLSTGTDVDA